jgi:hypothetical protein
VSLALLFLLFTPFHAAVYRKLISTVILRTRLGEATDLNVVKESSGTKREREREREREAEAETEIETEAETETDKRETTFT